MSCSHVVLNTCQKISETDASGPRQSLRPLVYQTYALYKGTGQKPREKKGPGSFQLQLDPCRKCPGMTLKGEVGKQDLQEEELEPQLDHKRAGVSQGQGQPSSESGLAGLSKGCGKTSEVGCLEESGLEARSPDHSGMGEPMG